MVLVMTMAVNLFRYSFQLEIPSGSWKCSAVQRSAWMKDRKLAIQILAHFEATLSGKSEVTGSLCHSLRSPLTLAKLSTLRIKASHANMPLYMKVVKMPFHKFSLHSWMAKDAFKNGFMKNENTRRRLVLLHNPFNDLQNNCSLLSIPMAVLRRRQEQTSGLQFSASRVFYAMC
jgi:hypothetical protein